MFIFYKVIMTIFQKNMNRKDSEQIRINAPEKIESRSNILPLVYWDIDKISWHGEIYKIDYEEYFYTEEEAIRAEDRLLRTGQLISELIKSNE